LNSAEDYINRLKLIPHPEGGFYAETIRSRLELDADMLAMSHGGKRNLFTSIYFLLKHEQKSKFHRLKSDEIWYYHDGGSLIIHLLKPDGSYESIPFGRELEAGEQLQVLIPAGTWFGAEVTQGDYVLMGCLVAPGFEFTDFEIGDRSKLLETYSAYRGLLDRLSCEY